MKRKIRLATTQIDRHLDRFTRDHLEKMAIDINNGPKLLATIEHDVTIPPRGKLLEAWVEPCGDGEHQLVAIQEIFDEQVWTKLHNGLIVFKQECESDRSPFADRYKDAGTNFELAYDPINFDSKESYQAFMQEIRDAANIEFTENIFGRKSAVPDPEFLLRLGEIIAAYLLSKKLVDKVGDKVAELAAEDAAKFYSFIRAMIVSAAKYVRPKGRPITYIFVVPGNPTIEFVARSTNTHSVLSAMLVDKLKQATNQALELGELLDAARIQYLLNEQGEWEFSYLLTNTGGVIGTEKSYRRRVRRLETFSKGKQGSSEAKNPRNSARNRNKSKRK